MAVKTLTTRVQQKSDTSANWAKATNFTPLKGEIIVYTDLRKIKIGDGVTKVGALEFANSKDAETLTGASLSTILNSSDVEIPTSKAVLDALDGKVDKADAGSDWNQNDNTKPNYVKNRPFYIISEAETSVVDINWNGDTDGLTPSSMNHFYKVSDSVFTLEQFKQLHMICNGTDHDIGYDADNNLAIVDEYSNLIFYSDSGVMIATAENAGPNPGGAPDTFPETGVYFPSDGSVTRLYSVGQLILVPADIKTIDESFLPSSVLNRMDTNNPVGKGSFSLNRNTNNTIGDRSVAVGDRTTASGYASHAEGDSTTASGRSSHAEGYLTTASGYASHSEGSYTTASGDDSHSEGNHTTASGYASHAEGYSSNGFPSTLSASSTNDDVITKWNTTKFSVAKADYSHVEGKDNLALGESSHAEGYLTTASGSSSHAEGDGTTASGVNSHAEGFLTTASGVNSHAEGEGTIASSPHQHVQGYYNLEDKANKYAHIVGNGDGPFRSNAHTLDWSGNAWFAGDVYTGSTSGTNKDEGSKKLATEEYVDSKQVQPDWNQNDNTQPDYIKNRPFYESISLTTFLEEQQIDFSSSFTIPNSDIVQGKTYFVHWDDAEYTIEATVKDIFGDGSIWVPYLEQADGLFTIEGSVMDAADKGIHNVAIYTTELSLKTIDEKFIPDTIARKDSVVRSVCGGYPDSNGNVNVNYDDLVGNKPTNIKDGSGKDSILQDTAQEASGRGSHAEGDLTIASGDYSHAEGARSKARGTYSHAEGVECVSIGSGSHAEGFGTASSSNYQHVEGKFNIEDLDGNYANIVGNGDRSARSNAHTLDWSGNAWFAGDVYTGSTSGTNKDEGSKKLATEEYVDSKQVQPDWNQNDDTQPDYVKNRPFYTGDTVEMVMLPETTITIKARQENLISSSFPYSFELGKTYVITFDGVDTEYTAYETEGIVVIGYDYSSVVGGSGYIVMTSNGKAVLATMDTSLNGSHTIAIKRHTQEIIKIDEKYLPDNPINNITGATIGQIVKIAAVDDTGKPTAWEADTQILFKPDGKSYLTFSSPNSFTLAVYDMNKHWDGILEYFASDKTWSTWDGMTTLSSVDNDGEHVLYLRGTGNTKITGTSYNYRWVLTGTDIKCIGNIENLLDYATVTAGTHPTMENYCYQYMFQECKSLTQAPALPATTLADYCYYGMFRGCTSLTQTPILPATTLAGYCYGEMFKGCKSITQAPILPATTLTSNCYYEMFFNCSSLIQSPALPATTLATSCYHSMFYNCTSLTQAPALPATTLADLCYVGMFYGCTALTKAPLLPATTLARSCYGTMFVECTNLIKAPDLPATTLAEGCYFNMFVNCTSLTQTPALPSTTLVEDCYSNMFRGCTSLTQIPELPANTLADKCYYCMFQGCTKIKLSSTKTGEYTQKYRISITGADTTTSPLKDMFASTGGTFTGTPAINTTYYLSTDNMIVRDTEVATLNGYVGSMIDDDAIDKYNGMTPVECVYTHFGSQQTKIIYVEEGTLIPPSSSASDDIKNAWKRLLAIPLSGLATTGPNSSFKDLIRGIGLLADNGVFGDLLSQSGNEFICYTDIFKQEVCLDIYNSKTDDKTITVYFNYYKQDKYQQVVYCISNDTFDDYCSFDEPVKRYLNNINATILTMPQTEMAAAPTKDMQIATKKYVDDSVSNPLILPSSTEGSTKRFKITVDDSGAITATEVT